MSWNYRIVARDVAGCTFYGIHEVHYDEYGQIMSWTKRPSRVVCDSLEALDGMIDMMAEGASLPVLQENGGGDLMMYVPPDT